jgi:hypothetical protein
MKRLVIVVVLILFAAGVRARESYPANSAAVAAGYTPFEAFHHIMAPAWHQAWLKKNYEALLAAGPKFAEAFVAIEQLKPQLKSEVRRRSFVEQRQLLGKLVVKYAKACEQGDSAVVYQLMPDLHDAFEATAATLLPVSFPEFEGLVITLDIIVGTHLPGNNVKGLVGSTETLLAKMENLIVAPLPTELEAAEDEITPRLEMMRHLVLHMLEALYQNDIKEYIIYATELRVQTDEFIAMYL